MRHLLRLLRRTLTSLSNFLRGARRHPPRPPIPDIATCPTTPTRTPEASAPPAHYIPWCTAQRHRTAYDQELRQTPAFNFHRRRLLKRHLTDSSEQARARDNERYLQSRTTDPELADLNPDQRRAVLTDDDRCLIVAGAGTGKTHTLTNKIRELIRQGRAAPPEIAVVTFTTKATRELRHRLADLPGIEIGTIHHLARAVIANLSGQTIHLSRLTEDDALRLRTITGWLRDSVFEQPDLISEFALRRAALKSVRVPPRRHHPPPYRHSPRQHSGTFLRRGPYRHHALALRHRVPIRSSLPPCPRTRATAAPIAPTSSSPTTPAPTNPLP